MKIIGIYSVSTSQSDRPGLNMLVWPDSAMIRTGKPLFIPDDSPYRLFISPGFKISRLGKTITPKFARRYFDSVAPMAVIMPERSALRIAENRHPYATDIVADCAVVCGEFISMSNISPDSVFNIYNSDIYNTDPQSVVNDNMAWFEDAACEAVVFASIRNTLKIGDLIIPLLSGSGINAKPDAKFSAKIDEVELLSFKLK